MTVCREHNPCPERPRRLLYRFTHRPWRCPQCGQFWVTRPSTLWGGPDGYIWAPRRPEHHNQGDRMTDLTGQDRRDMRDWANHYTGTEQNHTPLAKVARYVLATVEAPASTIAEELLAPLAGMTWQTGVHAGDEYIWAETPEEEAIAAVAAKSPEVRLVRRSVSAPEVINE